MVESTPVLEDSSSAIRGCQDYVKASASRKMRHKRLRFHILMHQVKDGVIELVKVGTRDQPTNALTKPLGSSEHWSQMPVMLGHHENIDDARNRILGIKKLECVYAALDKYDFVGQESNFRWNDEQTLQNTLFNGSYSMGCIGSAIRQSGMISSKKAKKI